MSLNQSLIILISLNLFVIYCHTFFNNIFLTFRISPQFSGYPEKGVRMLLVPTHISEQFDKYFQNQKTPDNLQRAYKKWLSYYLDFCGKYRYTPGLKDSLPEFIKKLQEKKQGKQQQDEVVIEIKH
jgi:hypothetical protein